MKNIITLCLLLFTASAHAASYGVSSQDGQTTVTVTLGQITGTASVDGLTDTSSMTVKGSLRVEGTGGETLLGPLTLAGSSLTVSGAGQFGGNGIFNGDYVQLNHVGGNADIYFGEGTGANQYGILHWNAAGNYVSLANQGNTDALKIQSGGVTVANSLTASSVTVTGSAFSVGGSTLAVLEGKVGIGTTAPSDTLHVKSANGIRIQDTSGSGTASSSLISFADDSDVRQSYIWKDSGGQMLFVNEVGTGDIVFSPGNSAKVNITAAGGLGSYSRTMAQLLAIAPSAVGQQYFCNNCTPAKMVVSTGTSAGNFADIMGGTFQ